MKAFVLDPRNPNINTIRANLHAFVDSLPRDKAWSWTWKRFVKQRSDPQNHALFGVAYPALTESTGYTKDELHEAFCKRWFGTVEREIFGQMVSKPFRTTTTDENGKRDVIDAKTFSDFYADVQAVGASVGICVPEPEPMGIR